MHKKTLLMALTVVSIICFITAATVNRKPAARARIAAAKPSEKDGSLVMDAPAVPTLHFTNEKSAFVSPGARGVSTPAFDEEEDDGAPAPVPTSVQNEATGDMSDAADKVEAANEGAPQSESEALESTRKIRRQHRRVPGASTSTRRRLREASTTQSDDEDDSSFGSRVDAPYVPDDVLHDPFGSLTNDRCGSVRYTFCPRLRHEVFYNRQSGQCIAITTAAEHEAEKEVAARDAARYHHTTVDNDAAPLCNSSPNRFSSLESCRQSCQRSELPAERCFEKTIFSECRKEHVVSTRWYFDGRRCREWHFPAGRCPSAHAFRSRAQCARACVVSATGPLKKSPQDGRCGGAQSRPCNERQLRFLYFADVASADGHVRCLKASQTTLVGRRCLVGPNRFDSIAKCRAACVRGGDEGAGHR